ncbi:transmembrane protein 53-like [Tubulanus polymorphus]|uniref:transmembrane protein 53-like n=1 Tax=Tubulanus polymorphus TaxID=672921 RepID=UPI003DA69DC0
MAEDLDDVEDLDFVVKFPSPGSTTGTGGIDEEESDDDEETQDSDPSAKLFVDTSNLDKEPVVILLGWMGCKDKYLAKYSEIYERKGCITIRYIPPMGDLFFKQSNLQKTAAKLLELIFDLSLENNSIFFHVFSNGGGYVYRNISELLHVNKDYNDIKRNIKGCMFDSCPSPGTVITAAQTLISSLQVNEFLRFLLLFTTILYLIAFRLWERFMGLVHMIRKPQQFSGVVNYYSAMKSDPMRCPQLFLYSKADLLISYKKIENVVRHRQNLGIMLMTICWEDSKHVQHLVKHRETYMKKCYDFMETCLHM